MYHSSEKKKKEKENTVFLSTDQSVTVTGKHEAAVESLE